jgi:hypothetical protein
MRITLVVVLALAACGGGGGSVSIEAADPPYGPLSGGTRIELAGAGFSADGQPIPTRVLFGGREAPLVDPIDDATLAVVVPPGDRPGDVEVVVLNANGNASATGVFRYSEPPTISAVSPADVLYSSGAEVTVTGTGFLDEGAGELQVLVGGVSAFDVTVASDTSLVFTAPIGVPLARPTIHVIAQRGTATRERAFRYTPGTRDGLILIPPFGNWFAIYYDPSDNSIVTIPRVTGFNWYMAVVTDDRGDYWGLDSGGQFGRIDFQAQAMEAPVWTGVVLPAMLRNAGRYLGIDAATLRFGELYPASGVFLPIGEASVGCCGSYGIATDGTTMYVASQSAAEVAIIPIDPATGAMGSPVDLDAGFGFHIEDMRFLNGTLYASSIDGTFATIDPASGHVTPLPLGLGRFTAMEVFRAAPE